jgi:hypothetical protein
MANGNFVVQNGLTVGGVTIDATSGNITTSGVVSTTNTAYPAAFNDLTIAGNIVATGTGYFDLPVGTTAQRPTSPNLGMVRYNTTTSSYEGFGAGSAWSSLGGVKSVDGKAYISAEISAGDATNVLRFYSGDSGTSTQVAWASTSNVSILPTTAATSSSTGALQVAGGVGIAGAVYTGGALYTVGLGQHGAGLQSTPIGNATPSSGAFTTVSASGVTTITNATASTGTGTGALVVTGGVGVAGDMWVGGTLTVANLQSRGSSQIVVQDPMLYLQANVLYPWNYDTGIFSDSIGGAANTYIHHGMVRNYVNSEWTFFSNVKSEPSGTINWSDAGITYEQVKTGHIVPGANVTYNLGSTTQYWNNIYGITFVGTSTTAKYADLAENYQADAQYAPGQVVEFGGAQEVTLGTTESVTVAGIVSTNPAHLMNGGLTGPNVVAVALQGRVPCNVIGPVKKGQMMISAGFGYARASTNPQVGQVIGKALSDFNGAKGQIEVVVGRC